MARVNRFPFSKKTEEQKKESIAADIRALQKKLGRVPVKRDAGSRLAARAIHAYGSWAQALNAATGNTARYRRVDDNELTKPLCDYYLKHGIPTQREFGRGAANTLINRFGGWHEALERAIGTSHRLEVLRALKQLTPPGCEVATSNEIATINVTLLPKVVGIILEEQMKKGLVVKSQVGMKSAWRLSQKGKEFLEQFTAR